MANLRIAELDFDDIKTNLKNYLRAQDEFTDYDFEGSGLSVLLDILAYNTHYNAYLANMLVNEMFLDSAVKRASAVSLAKHLGYTPRSTRSARAILDVTVNNPTGNPTSLTLDRYTPFLVSLDGTTYNFYNIEAKTIAPVSGVYTFNDLSVVEGTPLSITYVVSVPGPDEKYEIPSPVVDTSTLLVTVQTSSTDTTSNTYSLAEDINGLDQTSMVYFLEENPFEKYQIFFGDGIIGKKLSPGNIINIRYLASSGSDANSSNTTTQTFTATSIGGSSDIDVSIVNNPYGGAEKETISSIKFNAPKFNAAKNRAVTASDYEALILSSFTDAEAVSVWGGEENEPPVYGKVFISLKPFSGSTISQSTKDTIISQILADKKVLAIQPEFVDPEYFHVNLNVSVVYNTALTTKSASQIQGNVRDTITSYFSSRLQKFNEDFNKSLLTKLILETDTSIVSVIIKLRLQLRNFIFLNSINSFIESDTLKFQNSIVPGTISTSRFYLESSNTQILATMIDIPDTSPASDTGTGTIRIVNASTNAVINSNIGSINYGTGVVTINNFIPTALPNTINDFRMTGSVQESSHNIEVFRNQILVLDDSELNAAAGSEAGLTINVTAL